MSCALHHSGGLTLYLRNGRIGILDLSRNESSELPLEEAVTWESASSDVIAKRLAEENGGDCMVLATGLLTYSFVPAAAAGLVRGRPDPDGRERIAPILGFAGSELKLTGFDFIVLKGKASTPGYVWVRDGLMEFVPAQDMPETDSWKRIDRIRGDQGDNEIHVIANGPWGDRAVARSQLVIDYWGGEDKAGLGADLGRMGVSAIAFRGMGELDVAEPEGHFEDAILLMREHIEKLGRNQGLASYASVADRADLREIVHRHVACYGCPFPCRSFAKVEEDPKEFRLLDREPGYLHYDVPALEKAFEVGLDARSATRALMMCAKTGAEPCTILSMASSSGKVTLESVKQVLADIPRARNETYVDSPPGNFERSFENPADYRKCLGLGLCPRYWAKVGFDMGSVSAFAEGAVGRTLES